MRWLLHGTMTAAVADALKRHGHQATNMIDVGLPPAAAAVDVLTFAHKAQLDVLTTDASLAEAPFLLGQPFGRTIVYLQLEGGDVEQDDAVDRLFDRYKRLSPGRLYTVTASRVKVRQLPGKP
jgi:predicted nuclease of predicted toxin-antitoxin system